MTLVILVYLRIRQPVDADEVYWHGSTYYYSLALQKGNLTSEHWHLLPAKENPPLGKYFHGFFLSFIYPVPQTLDPLGSFFLLFKPYPGAWGAGGDYELREEVERAVSDTRKVEVRSNQFVPEIPAIFAMRLINVFFLLFSSVFFLLTLGKVYGCLQTSLGFSFFLMHPIAMNSLFYATVDGPALAWTLLNIVSFLLLLNAKQDSLNSLFPQNLFAPLLVAFYGITLGFAWGTKLNTLPLLGIPVGFALISLTAHRKKPSAQLIGRFAFGILLGIGVFLLSNPTLYRNPFLGVSDLVSIHQRTALIQAQFLSGATRTLWEKWLGLSHLLSVHPLVLLVVIIFCLIECRRQIFLGPVNTLLPLWFCTSFFSVWLWLPFAWDRYALPALLPMVLLLCSLIKFHMRRYFEAAVLQLRERKP